MDLIWGNDYPSRWDRLGSVWEHLTHDYYTTTTFFSITLQHPILKTSPEPQHEPHYITTAKHP